MDKHHQKFDFSQITEQIFLGTNLCCKTHSHIKQLLDMQITCEINLEYEETDQLPDVPVYLWLPVHDGQAPSFEQITAAVAVIDAMVKKQKRVYIHCKYGHGRSPTLLAAYFIHKGYRLTDAIQKIKKARPEIHINKTQMKALEQYRQTLNTSFS